MEVSDDLSKDQTLRIATVENLQRQNMTPLEEAAALCKLVHKGVTLDDVVAQNAIIADAAKMTLPLVSISMGALAESLREAIDDREVMTCWTNL